MRHKKQRSDDVHRRMNAEKRGKKELLLRVITQQSRKTDNILLICFLVVAFLISAFATRVTDHIANICTIK